VKILAINFGYADAEITLLLRHFKGLNQ